MNLETAYSVQQKAAHIRRTSGRTWSVEQSCKDLFLSSVKTWWTEFMPSNAQDPTTITEQCMKISLPFPLVLCEVNYLIVFLDNFLRSTY